MKVSSRKETDELMNTFICLFFEKITTNKLFFVRRIVQFAPT